MQKRKKSRKVFIPFPFSNPKNFTPSTFNMKITGQPHSQAQLLLGILYFFKALKGLENLKGPFFASGPHTSVVNGPFSKYLLFFRIEYAFLLIFVIFCTCLCKLNF